MGYNAFLKNLCGCLQEARRLGFPWRIVQELGCMTVILLQERLKKQVGLSQFYFIFYVHVSVWVMEMLKWKERDRKVSKFVMFSVVSGFQEKNNNPLQLSRVVGFG